MKLVVGLGNPGKEYENTRHNMGFFFIDQYAKYHLLNEWIDKKDFYYNDFMFSNEKVILIKPKTFMNNSGIAVKKVVDFYKINLDNILIISDDLDLPVGSYRLRMMGSSGGHNGLKSIETCLCTNKYKRLKIGISNNKNISTKDYVLSNISLEDQLIYNELTGTVNQIIDLFLTSESFENLMSKFNHK